MSLAVFIHPTKKAIQCRWYLGLILCASMGCASGDQGGQHISGTVTFQGKPIPYGKIEFKPDRAGVNDVFVGYAVISDGKFDTRNDGRAVIPGATLVHIYGFESGPGEVPPLEYRVPLFELHEIRTEIDADQLEYDFDVPGRAR